MKIFKELVRSCFKNSIGLKFVINITIFSVPIAYLINRNLGDILVRILDNVIKILF